MTTMFIVAVGFGKPSTRLACFTEMEHAFDYIEAQHLERDFNDVFIEPVPEDEDLYHSINR